MSWMARHVVEDHVGAYDVGNPVSEWIVSIDGAHRKPLNRQVKESINIKKARGGVQLKVLNRNVTVAKDNHQLGHDNASWKRPKTAAGFARVATILDATITQRARC